VPALRRGGPGALEVLGKVPRTKRPRPLHGLRRQDWKTIDDFTAKNPNTLPAYRDPDGATAKRFGSTQYPETYIANKSGRVIYRVQGAIDWNDPAVQQRIVQLLNS